MQLQLPDKEGITNYIILFVPMKKPKYVPKGIPRGMYLQTEDLGKILPVKEGTTNYSFLFVPKNLWKQTNE